MVQDPQISNKKISASLSAQVFTLKLTTEAILAQVVTVSKTFC